MSFNLLAIILIINFVLSFAGECPGKEPIKPCTCNWSFGFTQIICTGNQSIDLRSVVKNIINDTNDNSERLYNELVLSNSAIESIEADTFKGVFFNRVFITGMKKLSKISSKAFSGSEYDIEKLSISEVPNLNNHKFEYNIFDLINKLVNLRSLLVHAEKINQLPANAFNQLRNLTTVSFGLSMTKRQRLSIGLSPFGELDALGSLDLSANKIDQIKNETLRFNRKSTKKLKIILSSNELEADSFESASLTGFNGREVELVLDKNRIKYLDQDVFQAFFDANQGNVIGDIQMNGFNCTAEENEWLGQSKYWNRLKKSPCDDKKKVE